MEVCQGWSKSPTPLQEEEHMLRRLVVMASLCGLAIALVPVASASAASFVGSCEINGNATFEKPLSNTTPKSNKYAFKSGAGTTCTQAGSIVKAKAKAEVSGKGHLACAVAEGGLGVELEGETTAAGTGKLTIEEGAAAGTYEFKLSFAAAAAQVLLKIENNKKEVTATGDATFATSSEGVTKCANGEASELEFKAAAAGTIGE
jgi:hypothetical protein